MSLFPTLFPLKWSNLSTQEKSYSCLFSNLKNLQLVFLSVNKLLFEILFLALDSFFVYTEHHLIQGQEGTDRTAAYKLTLKLWASFFIGFNIQTNVRLRDGAVDLLSIKTPLYFIKSFWFIHFTQDILNLFTFPYTLKPSANKSLNVHLTFDGRCVREHDLTHGTWDPA